jgi:hypothetical protein
VVHDSGLRVKHDASVPDKYLRFKKLDEVKHEIYIDYSLAIEYRVAFLCRGNSTTDNDASSRGNTDGYCCRGM